MKGNLFKHSNNQDGFASIIVAIIFLLIASLITIGFTQLMIADQKLSLKNQLSQQSYYAAESGINDMLNYASTNATNFVAKNNCNSTSSFWSQFSTQYPATIYNNIKTTCDLVSTNIPNVLADKVYPGEYVSIPSAPITTNLQLSYAGAATPSSTGTNPFMVQVQSFTKTSPCGTPSGMKINQTFAYVINGSSNNLNWYNVTTPQNPQTEPSISLPGNTNPLALTIQRFGCHYYIFTTNNGSYGGVSVFRISNSNGTPILLNTFLFPVQPHGISIEGNDLYAVGYLPKSQPYGFMVYQITHTPGNINLTYVSSIPISVDHALYVETDGNYAYISSGVEGLSSVPPGTPYPSSGLDVVNISNPNSPQEVDTISPPLDNQGNSYYAGYSLIVNGSYLYVVEVVSSGISQYFNSTQLHNYILVYNISNQANPVFVRSVPTLAHPVYLTIDGNLMFLPDFDNNTFQVFNISDPSNPSVISSATTTTDNGPSYVAVNGNYAYVTDYRANQIQIFQIAPSPYNVNVSWQYDPLPTNLGTSLLSIPSGCGPNSNLPPNSSSSPWTCPASLVEATLVFNTNLNNQLSVSNNAISNTSQVYYLYPDQYNNTLNPNNINVTDTGSTPTSAETESAGCNSQFVCSYSFIMPANETNLFLRLEPFYGPNPTDFTVTLYAGSNSSQQILTAGSQIQFDATASVNNQLKRIFVRYPTGLSEGFSHALQTTSAICKKFSVVQGYGLLATNPAGCPSN